MSRVVTAAIVVIVVISLAIAQQPTTVDSEPGLDFKSKAAVEAKQRYELAVKEHHAAYAKGISEVEKLLLKDLKVALTEATRAADLDEALKIKAAAGVVERRIALFQTPVVAQGKLALPTGKWQLTIAQGVHGIYEFRTDGTVRWTQKGRQVVGRITVKDGTFLVVYPDDRTERLTPSGPRLLMEHWCPSSNYPNGFPTFGYAERVK